jgi:topoisomerase-4 subunit B
MTVNKTFNEIEITKLKFPDTIRKRFDMYIGSSDNPNQIIQELIDNGIDEILSNHANILNIYTTDTYTIISDNGRGIPIYADKDEHDSVITKSLFSETHVGSKFDFETTSSVVFSRGKNGVKFGALT